MKAIILTYAPVNGDEKEILVNTNVYKVALNQHAGEYKPDIRVVSDYVVTKIRDKFPEKIVSIREKMRCQSKRVEYFETEFKGSTMVAALEYLVYKGYDEILIVGDNKVNAAEFQDKVNEEVDKMVGLAKIYQYSDGNFHLPKMSISEFCGA